ncbi:MAG: T9SS type A sorting domain-containing protein [Fibrobacterota bacterium]|nr:MAG: T9SS type A sorting domain-containing protein [Fibrobacterota bacterium]
MRTKARSLLLSLGLTLFAASFSHATTNQFRGVNWADPRDNFQTGVIYLSGLTSSDNNASAKIVAERVVGQFVSKLGTNSVRLPINEATASTGWNMYTGVIDVALTKGRVILCYWGPAHGAAPPNMTSWWTMWSTVVAKYGTNKNFYIEIYNEPNMYNKTTLSNLYAEWLQKFPSFPQERIILDGTGMAQNVPEIGSDSRFNKCLLAVHDYSMWSAETNTEAQWSAHLRSEVGSYSDRTVATEWGGPMSTGSKNGITYQPQDYANTSASASYFVKYIRGMTEQLRTWKMGSFYWAGLKDNDWYSLMKKTGTGANIDLTVANPSGLARVQYSWFDTLSGVDRSGSLVKPPLLVYDGARKVLRVEFDGATNARASVRVSRPDGELVQSGLVADHAGSIDVSDLPAGMYLANLEIDGKSAGSEKILIGK